MASGLSDLLNIPTSPSRVASTRPPQRASYDAPREQASFTLPDQPAQANAREPQGASRRAAPAEDHRPASYESVPAPTEPPAPAKPASWSYRQGDVVLESDQPIEVGELSYAAPSAVDAAAQLAAAQLAAALAAPAVAPPPSGAPALVEEAIGKIEIEGEGEGETDAEADAQTLAAAAALELANATSDAPADADTVLQGAPVAPAAAAAAQAAAATAAALTAAPAASAAPAIAAVTAAGVTPRIAQTTAAIVDATRAETDGPQDATAEGDTAEPLLAETGPTQVTSTKAAASSMSGLADALEALGKTGTGGQAPATDAQATLSSAAQETPAGMPAGEPKPAAVPVEAKAAPSFEAPRGVAAATPRIEAAAPERTEQTTPQSGSGVVSQTGASFASELETARTAQNSQAPMPKTPLGAVPIELGMRAMAGVNRFEIRLDPAELGRIDVRLDIDEDGAVRAHLSVDRVETLALLQRDARTLERAFEQAGLKAAEGSVDLTLRDPTGQERNGRERTGDEGGRRGARSSGDDGPLGMNDPIPTRNYLWRGANGVDVRV